MRIVRLMGMDDPVDLEPQELRRIAHVEAAKRYRENHPDRVMEQNRAAYVRLRIAELDGQHVIAYPPSGRRRSAIAGAQARWRTLWMLNSNASQQE